MPLGSPSLNCGLRTPSMGNRLLENAFSTLQVTRDLVRYALAMPHGISFSSTYMARSSTLLPNMYSMAATWTGRCKRFSSDLETTLSSTGCCPTKEYGNREPDVSITSILDYYAGPRWT